MLVIVCKFIGNLLPYSRKLLFSLCVGRVGELIHVYPLLVVKVENNIHIVAYSIIDYLVNSCHPLAVDIVVVIKMRVPCCGDPDGVKALSLYRIYHDLCGFRIAPRGFGSETCVAVAACSVKRISEIPAYLHVLSDLESVHAACSVCCDFLRIRSEVYARDKAYSSSRNAHDTLERF